jgi:hypothetical protein
MPVSHAGARIGPKVAMLVSRAIIATHQGLLATKHKLAMVVFHAISDEISVEAQHVLGPTLHRILADPNLHPDIRPHIEFLAHRHGQLNAMAGTALSASGIVSSLALILNNYLAPGVYEAVGAVPNLIPDPGTIASLVAKGIDSEQNTAWAVHGQGINSSWFVEMIDAARSYPDIGTAMDMFRRGLITAEDLTLCAERNGMPGKFIGPLIGTSTMPLSPADAALASLRGNMTEAEAAHAANQWGVTQATFDIMVGNTGEPLGLMQLLEAYRRGFIDEARLATGIKQSRVRDEWIGVAEQLRYSPISIADAVNAVVQNQLGMSEGESVAQQNGLEPGSFTTLYNTAGEPLSRGEMNSLYNRGLVTAAEVEQASRESRLKNKYNGLGFELRRRLIEPRELSSFVEDGSVGHADAVSLAMESGLNAADAQIVVNAGSMRKMKTYRDRVVSAVETMYTDNTITQQTAIDLVTGLGYEVAEATMIFEAADFHRTSKLVSGVITALKAKYLGRHITDVETSGYLDALGVPSTQRDELMSAWYIEHAAYTKILTEAQIVKAAKDTLITPADGLQRLTDMGYSETDATLLLEGA